jgi:arsenite oxidase small subunit
VDEREQSVQSRRGFLKTFGALGAGSVMLGQTGRGATSENAVRGSLLYAEVAISTYEELQARGTIEFHYPDPQSPCLLIKVGRSCPGGVGPENDIVAYSTLCSHQGCPVQYNRTEAVFRCPCHFSQFDSEKSGQMICGQATRKLARIELAWSSQTRKIVATGVSGLIYGRQANT